MSETENKAKDEKEGVGLVGRAASAAGGLGFGALAQKTAVSYSVKSNLAQPYIDGLKARSEALVSGVATSLNATTAEEIRRQAEGIYNDVRHLVSDTLRTSDLPSLEAVRTRGTILNAAREAADAARTTPEVVYERTRSAAANWAALGTKAEEVAATTTPAQRETAAKGLMNAVLERAEETDRYNAAQKVKQIPWLQRLNPFAEGLHLSGTQKTLAIAAGTATAVLGAFGVYKAIEWMKASPEKSGRE